MMKHKLTPTVLVICLLLLGLSGTSAGAHLSDPMAESAMPPSPARPEAAPAISAQRIDEYLTGKGSPLAGHGQTFVDKGRQYNIDPRLLVAIAGAESTFGKYTCSAYNAWNWFDRGWCNSPFGSWDEGIGTVAQGLRRLYFDGELDGVLRNTIPLIGEKYCGSGCTNWVNNVTLFYQTELGGDLSDLAFQEAQAPPALRFPFPYGETWKVINGESGHTGTCNEYAVDFQLPSGPSGTYGKPVLAAAVGSVRFVSDTISGLMAIVSHDDAFQTWYAHLSNKGEDFQDLKTNDPNSTRWVGQGRVIGYVGRSGYTTGGLLHFSLNQHDSGISGCYGGYKSVPMTISGYRKKQDGSYEYGSWSGFEPPTEYRSDNRPLLRQASDLHVSPNPAYLGASVSLAFDMRNDTPTVFGTDHLSVHGRKPSGAPWEAIAPLSLILPPGQTARYTAWLAIGESDEIGTWHIDGIHITDSNADFWLDPNGFRQAQDFEVYGYCRAAGFNRESVEPADACVPTPTPVPGPNLKQTSDLTVSPSSPVVDQKADFDFDIRNDGGSTAYFREVFVQGHTWKGDLWKGWDWSNPLSIAPGQSRHFQAHADMWYAGTWHLEEVVLYHQDGHFERLNANGYRQAQDFTVVETPATPTPIPNGGATLYADINYGGGSERFTGDDPDLQDNPVGNDSVTSIRVDPGYYAILYEDIHYEGKYEIFTADEAYLGDNWIGNDTASSVRLGTGSPPRDNRVPDGWLDGHPGPFVKGSINLSGWARDEESGMHHVETWLDGWYQTNATYGLPRPDVGCDCGYAWSWDSRNVSDGPHVIAATYLDKAGNKFDDLVKTHYNFAVDNTLPHGYLDLWKAPLVAGRITIGGWARDQSNNPAYAGSGINRIEMRVDGNYAGNADYGMWRGDLNGEFGYSWSWDSTGAQDGPHQIIATYYDNAGNSFESSLHTYYDFTVDNTPPEGYLDTGTVTVVSGAVTIGGWARDRSNNPAYAGSGIQRVEMWVDGVYWGNASYGSYRADPPLQCNCGWSWTWDSTGVGDGPHRIVARYYDNAGNPFESPLHTYYDFTVDNNPPSNPTSVTETHGASSNVWQNSVNDPTFTWSGASDGQGTGVAGYHVYFGADPSGTCDTFVTSAGYDPPAVSTGTYHLRVAARDHAAHTASCTTLFTFKYDGSPPTGSLAINNNTHTTNQVAVLLAIDGRDEGSGLDLLRLSGDGFNWQTWRAYQSVLEWRLPTLNRITYTVTLQLQDMAGNVSAVIADSIYLDLYPPRPASTSYQLGARVAAGGDGQRTSESYQLAGSTLGQPLGGGRARSRWYRLDSGFQGAWPSTPRGRPPADEYHVWDSVMASSGDAPRSEHYRLYGTSGQPVADGVRSSENYQLVSGFWLPAGWDVCGDDFDRDGVIGAGDIQRQIAHWRTSMGNRDPDRNPDTPNYEARFDRNLDGAINVVDVMRLVLRWGRQCVVSSP